MTNPLPVPPSTNADAKNRAWRTLAQGLIVDVASAALITIGADLASPGFVWSKAHILLLAALVGKTVALAAVSYISRYIAPPKF